MKFRKVTILINAMLNRPFEHAETMTPEIPSPNTSELRGFERPSADDSSVYGSRDLDVAATQDGGLGEILEEQRRRLLRYVDALQVLEGDLIAVASSRMHSDAAPSSATDTAWKIVGQAMQRQGKLLQEVERRCQTLEKERIRLQTALAPASRLEATLRPSECTPNRAMTEPGVPVKLSFTQLSEVRRSSSSSDALAAGFPSTHLNVTPAASPSSHDHGVNVPQTSVAAVGDFNAIGSPAATTMCDSSTTVPKVKYDHVKMKYHQLRSLYDASQQRIVHMDEAWRAMWYSHTLHRGCWRTWLRTAPNGHVHSSTGSSDPTSRVQGGSGDGVMVSFQQDASRKAKLDGVLPSTLPTWDAAQRVVETLMPACACRGSGVVLVFGSRGSGRTSFAHDVCAAAALGLASSSLVVSSAHQSLALHITGTVCDDDDIWRLPSAAFLKIPHPSPTLSPPLAYADVVDVISPLFHERRSRYATCHLVITIDAVTTAHSDPQTQTPSPTVGIAPQAAQTSLARFTVVDVAAPGAMSHMINVATHHRLWFLSNGLKPSPQTPLDAKFESSDPLSHVLYTALRERDVTEGACVATVDGSSSKEESSWEMVATASRFRRSAALMRGNASPAGVTCRPVVVLGGSADDANCSPSSLTSSVSESKNAQVVFHPFDLSINSNPSTL